MLLNTFSYKGYTGTIDYCLEDSTYYGEVLGHEETRYSATTIQDLEAQFVNTVERELITRRWYSN